MSKHNKHQKAEVFENPLSTKTGTPTSVDRLLNNHTEIPSSVKKEINGIWAVLLFAVLFLLAIIARLLTK